MKKLSEMSITEMLESALVQDLAVVVFLSVLTAINQLNRPVLAFFITAFLFDKF
ncbi:MAG: hypothetical protein MR039_02280 [Elusimicrobia bacterium]|nr:hypothetical protein [Elusimicrobiota bacterium]